MVLNYVNTEVGEFFDFYSAKCRCTNVMTSSPRVGPKRGISGANSKSLELCMKRGLESIMYDVIDVLEM